MFTYNFFTCSDIQVQAGSAFGKCLIDAQLRNSLSQNYAKRFYHSTCATCVLRGVRLCLSPPALPSCSRRRPRGAVAGRCWLINPHQRRRRGCRQGGAAVHPDQDAGASCSASTRFLHSVPQEEKQTAASRRSGHLQLGSGQHEEVTLKIKNKKIPSEKEVCLQLKKYFVQTGLSAPDLQNTVNMCCFKGNL